ncbi:hypothetical protein BDN72DRAFT_841251 [Pluteus cervinus]|uniref:Uncharacterized protein n=1 Tax=Pluteus cervinus TaxID=181527 RepID=A0ACD3AUC8_9AGAR|nr:hypothetical protein BDN72DRAFT_841251 [Pluteus cervinus]
MDVEEVAIGTAANDRLRPFSLVSQELRTIGSVSVLDFLSGLFDNKEWITTGLPIDQDHQATPITSNGSSSPGKLKEPEPIAAPSGSGGIGEVGAALDATRSAVPLPALMSPMMDPSVRMQGVASLHQTCHRVFGSSEALKFEFVEEAEKGKQCILTITRPDGMMRSFKTEPIFSRKSDAKVQAAAIAINHGALDFIVRGDSDEEKAKKGTLLVPIHTILGEKAELEQGSAKENPSILEIEQCCTEWRAGKVKPLWVTFFDTKIGKNCGMALRISLTRHSYRVHSSEACYGSPVEAKVACAKVALDEGILDFIKYGNGQTEPAKEDDKSTSGLPGSGEPITPLTLQSFYESLAQPFPEPVENMTAHEINAPAWLNITMQSARGGRLRSYFHYYVDHAVGLHGAILRLERPGACKTYLVDCRFSKRSDAKAAVCLLAMSNGVGEFIRSIKKDVDERATYDKRLVNDISLFLNAECTKIRPDFQPAFSFESDRDAFGCTMTIDLSFDGSSPSVRTIQVPPEYRTKADAKAAVAFLAIKEGIVEFIRFRGNPPSPGYIPFELSHLRSDAGSNSKRKGPDGDTSQEIQTLKKRKTGTRPERQGSARGILSEKIDPSSPSPERPGRKGDNKFYDRPSQDPQKKPHVSTTGDAVSPNNPGYPGRTGKAPRHVGRNVGYSGGVQMPQSYPHALPHSPSAYPLTPVSDRSPSSSYGYPPIPPPQPSIPNAPPHPHQMYHYATAPPHPWPSSSSPPAYATYPPYPPPPMAYHGYPPAYPASYAYTSPPGVVYSYPSPAAPLQYNNAPPPQNYHHPPAEAYPQPACEAPSSSYAIYAAQPTSTYEYPYLQEPSAEYLREVVRQKRRKGR